MTQRQGAYPDAGLIFDSRFTIFSSDLTKRFPGVMARYEYKQHPNNVSSMLFYIASIIIHGRFFSQHASLG